MAKDNRTNDEIVALIKADHNRQDNFLALYNKNMGAIYNLCKQYGGSIEMSDLLQEAFIILAEAVDRYEPNSNYGFLTQLRYSFLTHFNRVMRPNTTAVKLPCYFSTMIQRYKKMTQQYKQERNEIPDDKTYCRALKITYTDLANIRKHLNVEDAYSLDYEYKSETGSTIPFSETLEDPKDATEEILNREQQEELHSALDQVLSGLPSENSDVLKAYFYNNMPLQTYAKRQGITLQTARLLKAQAIRQIRRQPESIKHLRYFLTPDEMRGIAYNRKSVRAFLTDQTSITEQAALKIIGLEQQKRRTARKQTAYYDHIATKYTTDEQIAAEQ